MNQKIEAISQLVDGDVNNIDECIDFLLESDEAKRLWATSHDLKQTLQAPESVLAREGFAQKIAARIEQEPSILLEANVDIAPSPATKTKGQLLQFFKPIAGLSVAATVAALAVFGVDNTPLPQQGRGGAVAEMNPPAVPANTQIVPVTFTGDYDHRTYWVGSDKETSNELNRYLATHLEHANPGGFQSVMPYVRVVGYDDE